jgi:ParB-like nuclease family protein
VISPSTVKRLLLPAKDVARNFTARSIVGGRRLLRSASPSPRARNRASAILRRIGLEEPLRRCRVAATYRGPFNIPMTSLLLGGEGAVPGARYADMTNDPLRTSRPFVDGPHVKLLRDFGDTAPEQIPDDVLLDSAYGRNAEQCLRVTGSYFDATTRDDIPRVIRRVLRSAETSEGGRRPIGASVEGIPLLVRPISFSNLYQVVDGNHRLAQAAWWGEAEVEVFIHRRTTQTAAQQRLRDMSWLRGSRELYQPVPLPEVSSWPLVRRCEDRLAMMTTFLGDDTTLSYLDVASFLGWFVAQMSERGYSARGVERDPLAVEFGNLLYSLPPDAVAVADVVEYLGADRSFDVISCFSLMHHFALGRGSVTETELLELIDRACKRVLFVDTGQATERWFRDLLPDWTPDYIGKWLLANSTFTRVHTLGTDSDGTGKYAGNYGRTLFACTRD